MGPPYSSRMSNKVKRASAKMYMFQRFNILNISPVQTDATLLAKNSQHCWILHVTIRQFAHPVACCYVLLGSVASVCAPVQHGRNIVGATMLEIIASLFQVAYDERAHVRCIKILTWLRGSLVVFYTFGLVCAQVSSGNYQAMDSWKICNFVPKTSESCENLNIWS